jgi:hypothetical protein
MYDVAEKTDVLLGGQFIIKDSNPEDTFIPEEINEEQKMIKTMVEDFLHQEILPVADKL